MKNLFLALLAIIAFAHSPALGQAKNDSTNFHAPLKPVIIHQEIDFKANPQRVYEALLDTKQFSEFSGMSALIDPAVGGTFSVFNKHIIGRNLELIPGQRIVQAWRVVDWPAGVYSIARFELTPSGTGTHLVIDHKGFPEDLRDHLAEGWQLHYWGPLTKYLH